VRTDDRGSRVEDRALVAMSPRAMHDPSIQLAAVHFFRNFPWRERMRGGAKTAFFQKRVTAGHLGHPHRYKDWVRFPDFESECHSHAPPPRRPRSEAFYPAAAKKRRKNSHFLPPLYMVRALVDLPPNRAKMLTASKSAICDLTQIDKICVVGVTWQANPNLSMSGYAAFRRSSTLTVTSKKRTATTMRCDRFRHLRQIWASCFMTTMSWSAVHSTTRRSATSQQRSPRIHTRLLTSRK